MTDDHQPAAELAGALGHDFARPELLETALTHSSAAGVAAGTAASYERLEFLGDRVVGLVIADTLMRIFPDENEGDLSRRLARLVDGDSMADIASATLDLGAFMRLSPGERHAASGGNRSILADALESVIGAIYCDGGLDAARPVIERLWAKRLDASGAPPTDPKTALQEWAQGRGMKLPDYSVVSREGPDHAPLFVVEVAVTGKPPARGEGSSKRAAERAAAEALMAELKVNEDD
ncbi:MAG: ribonuclease III [Alphaproteobacteria bacterium]